MTQAQAEAEAKLLDLSQQMREIYRQYTGNVRRLHLEIYNGNIHMWNSHWEWDKNTPIKIDEREEK